MRISEFHQRFRSEYPSSKDGRTKTKGIRAAWKRTNRGKNKGTPAEQLLFNIFAG